MAILRGDTQITHNSLSSPPDHPPHPASNDEAQATALAGKYRNSVPQLMDVGDRRMVKDEITKHDLVIRYSS